MKTALFFITLLCLTQFCFSQESSFLNKPHLETSGKTDTSVVPDIIYISILITESDSKGKESIEELENKMLDIFKNLNIDIEKQLSISIFESDFKKFVFKQKDIIKTKSYSLIVHDAPTTSKVFEELEKEGISNLNVEKTEYSKMKELKIHLKSKAVVNAKQNAIALITPLGQKLGKAIFISDYQNHKIYNGPLINNRIQAYSSFATIKRNDLFSFKKIKIETEVSVVFEIE